MKTLLTFLLLSLITLTSNSQVIQVTMKRWTTFDFPGEMSIHDANIKDSVNYKTSDIGELIYNFDLDNKVIFISSNTGWKSVFNIKNIIPTTKSILNIDAEQDGMFYNFLVTKNVDNEISFIAQRFDLVEGKRQGFFSNSVSYFIK